MLADIYTDVAAAKALVLSAAERWDAETDRKLGPSSAKLFASEALARIADTGVQIQGDMGYMRESAVERFYRHARLFRIYEGTSEIQRVVVTGGAQGLGLAMARRLVDSGAEVVLGDMNEKSLAAAVESLGGVDIWVNNAGITRDAAIRKMSEQEFDDVISVHLRRTWNGLKIATALLREQDRGGSIVNVSSISGKVGNPGQSNYSAAKAGIVGVTKAAAKEVAFKNIRINAIQPGFINTAMPQHAIDSTLAGIPLGRPGEPEEVASVVLFLASGLSSYLTGTVTEISGGRHI